MKFRILNILLVITSLFAYLEWGGGNKEFLFQMEKQIVVKLFTSTKEVFHPFVILPLLGQLILIVNTLRKKPIFTLTYIGTACLAVLLLFVFIIGTLSKNYNIIVSVIPFIVTALWSIKTIKTEKRMIR